MPKHTDARLKIKSQKPKVQVKSKKLGHDFISFHLNIEPLLTFDFSCSLSLEGEGWGEGEAEIPNSKLQITNKFKYPNSNQTNTYYF